MPPTTPPSHLSLKVGRVRNCNRPTLPCMRAKRCPYFRTFQGASSVGETTLSTETEVARDDVDLIWPDTFAMDAGFLYATTNRCDYIPIWQKPASKLCNHF